MKIDELYDCDHVSSDSSLRRIAILRKLRNPHVGLSKREHFAENVFSRSSRGHGARAHTNDMNYHDSVLGLIGHTPLIKLNRLNKALKPLILAKMENLNPGFSVKDRIGISMIDAAEREGK